MTSHTSRSFSTLSSKGGAVAELSGPSIFQASSSLSTAIQATSVQEQRDGGKVCRKPGSRAPFPGPPSSLTALSGPSMR
eukprot:CAMPEP_0117667280 /NCGR_PEP_ID=MMETSP0804-20121206/10867_1 /TAXON_ID=1074897 /ORGANISM="Tetraselmis astigmatica, Strain CCMP880" /LENGTH=78 /DNA_ID=CAMNT_0005474965 /DNA_START=557 /DNA_END=793 /DNA_ORIENTATION=+